MRALLRLFTEHPASVNETYGQHFGSAWYFGTRLVGAGLACLAHGLFPFLFTTTGSTAVRQLHDRMVVNRVRPDPRHDGSDGPRPG